MEPKHFALVGGIIVIITVFVLLSLGRSKTISLYDCGSDYVGCFRPMVENCTPAKVTVITQYDKARLEVRGVGENNNTCILYMYEEEAYSPDFEEMVGKDMTCTLPRDDPTAVLRLESYCEGPLLEMFKEKGRALKKEMQKLEATDYACVNSTYWDFPETKYIVKGVEETNGAYHCHLYYEFSVGEMGRILVDHFYNRTDEFFNIQYTDNPGVSILRDICDNDGWQHSTEFGISNAFPLESAVQNNTFYCHAKFVAIPNNFPSIDIDLILNTGGNAYLLLKTEKGSVIPKEFKIT